MKRKTLNDSSDSNLKRFKPQAIQASSFKADPVRPLVD